MIEMLGDLVTASVAVDGSIAVSCYGFYFVYLISIFSINSCGRYCYVKLILIWIFIL